jgi:hypothetical protein
MTAVGTLQVQEPRLIVQQVLPVRFAIAAALAIKTPDGVVALWAAEPGAATSVGSGINREHGQPPDPEALRQPPGRRRYVADHRPDRSTASRTPDLPGPALHLDPSRPRSLQRWLLGGAPRQGSGRMRTPDDQAQQPLVLPSADMSNELPASAVALAVGNGLRHIRQLRLITLSSRSGRFDSANRRARRWLPP